MRRRVLVVTTGTRQERACDAAIRAGGRGARLCASSGTQRRQHHAPPGLHWRQVVDLHLPAGILETPLVRPPAAALLSVRSLVVPLAIAAGAHACGRHVSLAGPSWCILSALGIVVVVVLVLIR